MRRSFTAAEIRLARKFADEYRIQKRRAEGEAWQSLEYVSDVAMRETAKKLKLRGRLKAGSFRTVFVTKTLVFKVQRTIDDSSTLYDEFKYIRHNKVRQVLARHFPLSFMVGRTLMIQERIRLIDGKSFKHLNEDVEALAEFLGIDDAHSENFGWAGPKGREWPVFIDMDTLLSNIRGRKKRIRSWMKFSAAA